MPRAPYRDNVYETAKKGGDHGRNKRKHRERPCPNPPAAPTGVTFTFKAREAKTHLEFSGKVKWNAVTEDEQGHKIPGGTVEIDHYEIQVQPTDAAGVPKETEDGHSRVRRYHKKAVKGIRVVDAKMYSGTTAVFTTKKAHGFDVDEIVRVQDVKPSAYNGKWTVTNVPTSSTFRADIGTTANDLEQEGTVEGEPDPNYNIIIEHLSNPKKWYWQARVRAWDNKQCPSDWSPWTTPALPWTGANPKPPAPTNLDLDFEDVDKTRFERWAAFLRFDEVTDFDYPGEPADDEEDVSRYAGQLQVSNDGSTAVGRTRRKVVEAKDEDADSEAHIKFMRIKGTRWYRGRVRSIDRFNRRSVWTAWTAWQKPGQEVPPSPLNVKIRDKGKASIALDWDAPTEPGDDDEVNEEIEHFQVQIATSPAFGQSVLYAWDKRVTGEKKAIMVKTGDRGLTFYGRVRSVSSERVKGVWIPATLNGNSSEGATADGVTLEEDKEIATWTKSGEVEAKHYGQLWTAHRRYRFKKARVRFGRHDSATHPADGCPQGSSAIIQVFWHSNDESTQSKVFEADARLVVNANTHKDSTWAADGWLITTIEEDEHLSVKVTQVGSTAPGEDMVVHMVMVPD